MAMDPTETRRGKEEWWKVAFANFCGMIVDLSTKQHSNHAGRLEYQGLNWEARKPKVAREW